MRPTIWQRLDLFSRHQVPLLVTLLLALVAVVPTHVPGLVRVGPLLTLISVYYWAVHRPDLMGYGAVFAIGLLEDLVAGTPLGAGALTLLLVQGIVASQAKFFYGKAFVVTWWAFIVIAGGAVLIRWLCISVVQGTLLGGDAALATYLMTVAFYPPVAWLLARTQMAFLRDA
jgi:rod shape-determining protein MreD